MGEITQIDEEPTGKTYTIQDETGQVKAKSWISENESGGVAEDDLPLLKKGAVVRLFGLAGMKDAALHVRHIRLCSGEQEREHHRLLVTYAREYLARLHKDAE